MFQDVYQPYFLNNTYHLLYPPISSFAADEVSKDHESCHMYEPRCYEENRTDFSGCATVECQFGHYFPSNYSQPRVSMVNQVRNMMKIVLHSSCISIHASCVSIHASCVSFHTWCMHGNVCYSCSFSCVFKELRVFYMVKQ